MTSAYSVCTSRSDCDQQIHHKLKKILSEHPKQANIILKMQDNWNRFELSVINFESVLNRTSGEEYEVVADTCVNDVLISLSNQFLNNLDGTDTCSFY